MIDRLEALVRIRAEATPGRWWAQDGPDHWQLFGSENPLQHGCQILKAPKRGTPYAEYWPNPQDAALMVTAVNTLPAFLALALAQRNVHHSTRRKSDGKAVCERCRESWPCATQNALEALDRAIVLETKP
jgi:hypothetical protein